MAVVPANAVPVPAHGHDEYLVRRAQPGRPQRAVPPVPAQPAAAVPAAPAGDGFRWRYAILALLLLALLAALAWNAYHPASSSAATQTTVPAVQQAPAVQQQVPTPAVQRRPLPGQLVANVPPGCDTITVAGQTVKVEGLPAGECLNNMEIFSTATCPSGRALAEPRGKSKLAPGGHRWHFKCLPA